METSKKNFKNPKFRWIVALFIFTAMAGFLFLGVTNTAHATGGYEAIDPYGLYDPSGGVAAASDAAQNNPDACSPGAWIFSPIICALEAVLGFVALLLQASTALFSWIVKVGNMNALLNAGATGSGGSIIYELWRMVRDILNIAFILVLLFSAFATIFQVEKYSYKKLLLNLVLMALLVNFSYPIARFIIDVSNVLMYTLIRNLLEPGMPGGAGNTLGILSSNSGITNMLDPGGTSISFLLAAIVFTFLLAITFLAIGVMFIIRMIALTILIIFSPIAFVGAILPGKTAGYASQWWDYLFRYAFFGPIMIFIIYITVRIMSAMGSTEVIMTFINEGKNNSTAPNIVSAIAFFSIPIILLWIGMSLGQNMGIAGSATVMGYAQKTGSWAGKKFSGYNAVSKRYGAYKAERDKRTAAKFKDNWGTKLGEKANMAQDSLIARAGGKGAQARLSEMERKKIQEIREDWKKMGGASEKDISDGLASRDSAKRKAAAMEAADKVGFNVGDGKNDAANLTQYQKAADAFKSDPVLKKLFDDKVKEKHIKFVIEDEISKSADKSEGSVNAIYKKHLDGLTGEDFAKQKGLHENIAAKDNSGAYLPSSARFQTYVRNNIAGDVEHHKEIFKKLSREQRAAYEDASLAPDMKKKSGRLKSDNSPEAKERYSQEKWDAMTDR